LTHPRCPCNGPSPRGVAALWAVIRGQRPASSVRAASCRRSMGNTHSDAGLGSVVCVWANVALATRVHASDQGVRRPPFSAGARIALRTAFETHAND
jgi:hypothetical protein